MAIHRPGATTVQAGLGQMILEKQMVDAVHFIIKGTILHGRQSCVNIFDIIRCEGRA